VGVTEEQARARRRRIRVLRWPFHENDRARAERQTSGHIKIVTDAGGTILGATIVGPHADELIALWVLAIGQGLKIHTIAGLVLPVPVLSDVGTRAAMTWFASRLTSSWPRRIIHTLRIFG
jgi:pyruvate/2-oxoglutarate dehydrogenase complex dihydrolipoamide dehydrogenase (E3) component